MTMPLRVLILEDRPADAELMVYELRRAGYEVEWQGVDNRADYLAHLDLMPDLILADYSLPQWDAPSALRALQERGLDIPFIMVSGTVGEEEAVECMKQGADDYLLKDRLVRLGPAVSKALEDKRLRVEKRQAEAALRESEEKFRNLFNNAEVGMFRTRLDGSEVLDANEKYLEILGRSHEEVQGQPSVMHWVDPRDREDMVRQVEAEGRVTAFECKMLNKQGEVRTCLTSLRLFREQGILEGSIVDITERKQAQQALITSEARYRRLFEAARDGILILDAENGRVMDVNPFLLDLLGYLQGELLGKELWEIGLFRDIAASQVAFRELRETGYIRYEDLPLETRNGRQAEVEFVSNVYAVDGRQVIQCNIRDITERKRAEEALRTSETFLDSIIEHSPHAMWISDAEGTLIRQNQACRDLLAITDDEVIGKYNVLQDSIVEEQGYLPLVRRVFEQGEIARFTIEYKTERLTSVELGKHVTVILDVTISPVLNADGRVIHAIIQHVDITERKRTEEALRKLSGAVEHSPSIVYITDADGRLEYVNPKFTEITGYTAEEAAGKLPRILDPDKISREAYEERWNAIRSGGEWRGEFQNRRKNGDLLWESASISSIKDENGAISNYVIVIEEITERKRAEHARRESEQRYQSLFENMLNGFSYCKMEFDQGVPRDFVYLDVNSAFAVQTGLKDVKGKKVSEVIPGIRESNPEVFDIYARVALTGVPEQFETYVQGLDMWFWISVYSPAKEYFVAVFDVITERKRAEQALLESEARLHTVLENMPVMLDALDEDLNIIVWNRECERVTGYNAEEIIHHPNVGELLYPDPAYRARIQGELAAGRDYRDWERETTCKDGRVRTISWSNISREFPVPGWVQWGIGVDVTERKLAENKLLQWNDELEQRVTERTAELNHAKERIETILNSSSDALILCRPDGTVDQANPAFREIFEYTSETIFNERLAKLITTEEDAYRLDEIFATVIQTQHPMRLEIMAYPPARPAFSADIVLSPVTGDDGHLVGVVCSLRDNTARKQMEDQLRHMLEHEMELSELKSRYVSMAAHDLRNPLAVIRSAVDLIQRYGERLSEKQKQTKYDHIQASINVMVSLLDDILTIGQVESGKLAFNPAPLNVIAFCQNLSMEMSQTAGAASRIDFSGQGECRNVLVDAKLLRHILGNLLSNAIKYSPEGGNVIFSVDCQPGQTVFRVQDHGIGIPEADRKHLFETFHRASNVRHMPGTGLGLAIVRQSVVLHSGTISFESEIGAGTTFTVVLPLAETPASGDRAAGSRDTG